MLQTLGLSHEAELIYQEMISTPTAGVSEIGGRLGLPEQRVRDGLDELVHFALARESRDQPGRLRMVSPDVALNTLLRREEQELALRQQELEVKKAAVTSAVAEYAQLEPNLTSAASERLVGLDRIQARLESLAGELRSECLSVMPGGAQSQASLDASRPLDQEALERGISILTLYQDSVRNDTPTFEYARWLTALGGQVRTAPVVPPRMLIFDRDVAVIPIDPTNTKLGALCTRESAIVSSLTAIYEQAWQAAVPLGTVVTPDDETGLSTLDQQLLRLLASGLTDEAAGNRLGISARTVRRQMAAMMERLGAASRFEAGLKAAQRGWL